MTEYQTNGFKTIKGFIDPVSVATLSRYAEYRVNQAEIKQTINDNYSKYSFYADPLIETILYNSKEQIQNLLGLSVFPTYSYLRVYVKGDEMERHTDRRSCEISLTVNIAIDGEPWPIFMRYPGSEPVKVLLNPGDAVIYQGCVVEHWREPLQHAQINAQFMLHYVDQNGPNEALKFDTRPNLGLPINARTRRI